MNFTGTILTNQKILVKFKFSVYWRLETWTATTVRGGQSGVLSVIHLRAKSFLISAWKLFYHHPIENNQNLLQPAKSLKSQPILRLDFRLTLHVLTHITHTCCINIILILAFKVHSHNKINLVKNITLHLHTKLGFTFPGDSRMLT